MQKVLFLKVLVVGLLALLLGVPLSMIGGLVAERQARHVSALQEVAVGYAGRQRIVGPVLVWPYVDEHFESSEPGRTAARRTEGAVYVFPESLEMRGTLDVRFKQRGIFHAPVYGLQGSLTGRFRVPEGRPGDRTARAWGSPCLSLGIDDPRGFTVTRSLRVGDASRAYQQGARVAGLTGGLHASLEGLGPGDEVPFQIDLGLPRGGTAVNRTARPQHRRRAAVRVAASAVRRQVPARLVGQEVGPAGFRARWHVTALATRAEQQFLDPARGGSGCVQMACLESIEVRLTEPVNVCSLSNRALKYGFLFVWLSCAAFLLFELVE